MLFASTLTNAQSRDKNCHARKKNNQFVTVLLAGLLFFAWRVMGESSVGISSAAGKETARRMVKICTESLSSALRSLDGVLRLGLLRLLLKGDL
jgi:hypothetical protein